MITVSAILVENGIRSVTIKQRDSNALSADWTVAFAEFKSPANESWYAWVKFECTFSNPNCSMISFSIIYFCFFTSFSKLSSAWIIESFIDSVAWLAITLPTNVFSNRSIPVTDVNRNSATSIPKIWGW